MITKITQLDLNLHAEWLQDNDTGARLVSASGKIEIDANLSSANLRYADLRYANLSYANLRSADLSSANLSSANLRYANLSSANLRYADLSSADLSSANLSSANLRYAKGIVQIGPGGSRGDFVYAVAHQCTMIKCGCFWGTLVDFAAKVEETHGDNKYGKYYRAVITMVQAWEGAE